MSAETQPTTDLRPVKCAQCLCDGVQLGGRLPKGWVGVIYFGKGRTTDINSAFCGMICMGQYFQKVALAALKRDKEAKEQVLSE